MSTLEIFATIFTLLSVFLAVKLKTNQYPVGIVGSILYFFVFWQCKLYFSAYLQVFFTFVQFYGWWYWMYGDKGQEPKVTKVEPNRFFTVLVGGTVLFANIASFIAVRVSDAAMPLMDAGIFGASVIAQWYLDRKKLETWIAWLLVDIVSIGLYYSQGLMLTTGVYVVLLVNTFWGYYEWNKEFKSYKV
jgi:nicotinamide mononucleotide transporter